MGRAPCCDKANVKKGPWSPEEDAKLKDYMKQHGTGGNWITLPQKIGLKRCGKSCRLRWMNYLRPNIKHGGFSAEEDDIICNLYLSIGGRWSIIAHQLPGRTDNDIKNYWNTKLKKKMLLLNEKRNLQTEEIMKMETTCRSLMANTPDYCIPWPCPNHQASSLKEEQKSAAIKSEGTYSDQQCINYNNDCTESNYQGLMATSSPQQHHHYHRSVLNPVTTVFEPCDSSGLMDPQENGLLDLGNMFDGIYNFSNADYYRELDEGFLHENDSKQGLMSNGPESFRYEVVAMSRGNIGRASSTDDDEQQAFGRVK